MGFPLTWATLPFSQYFSLLILPAPLTLSLFSLLVFLPLFASSSHKTTQVSGEKGYCCLQEAWHEGMGVLEVGCAKDASQTTLHIHPEASSGIAGDPTPGKGGDAKRSLTT